MTSASRHLRLQTVGFTSELEARCIVLADDGVELGDVLEVAGVKFGDPMTVTSETMTGEQIVDLCRRHTLFEWSAQSAVDPIPVARAKGIYFWTTEGKRFIDFNSQLMCVNIGHGDERVIRAVEEQLAVLAYANPFMATEPRARLGAKLAEIAPGDIDTFFFTNGGAEANENAIKIARFFTGRHKIMARYRSYHGATAGAISLTGDPRRWAAEPGMPGVVRVLDP